MLGNWSFGDYFKKEAIAWAWELLTDVWKLDPTRLHVTVFEGDPDERHAGDDEAAGFWRRSRASPESHIHLRQQEGQLLGDGRHRPVRALHRDPLSTARRTRPAASSSTRARDRGHRDLEPGVHPVQPQRGQSLTPLPAKHVDTGMGFERITAVLQGKDSNYDTDVFTPIFEAIQKVTGGAAVHRQARRSEGHGVSRDRGPHPDADVRADRRRRSSATRAAAMSCAASFAGPSAYGWQVLGTAASRSLHNSLAGGRGSHGRGVPGTAERDQTKCRQSIIDEEECIPAHARTGHQAICK